MQVNAGFSFYEYLQNSRQFHAHRATDNQRITKSYEKAVAFSVFVICIYQKKVVPLPQVNALYESLQNEKTEPTFLFEGEDAEDIYKRYLTWVWKRHQAQIREIPGAQPRAAKHRNFVVARETDWSFIEEVQGLNEAQKQLLTQWMFNWQKFINKHLKPEKEVRFWTEEVSAHRQKQLTQYLRIQEKEWDYFRSLSAAIYALRQMGYVRRACSLRDITRWMSEQLVKDYSTKNNHDQFVRAWKDLGRYTPEVKDYVESLKENGVMPLNGIY